MKKRKLRLSAETLRVLSESQAKQVVGGDETDQCTGPCTFDQTCGGSHSCSDTCETGNHGVTRCDPCVTDTNDCTGSTMCGTCGAPTCSTCGASCGGTCAITCF